VYTVATNAPNAIITFADGAIGYFYAGEVFSAMANRAFSTGEYGQLFNLPFPLKIHGLYTWMSVAGGTTDADMVLYSAPLSTPVAEKTVSLDSNTISATTARRVTVLFATPYTYAANSDVAIALKPTSGTNTTIYYKTLASAAHRVTSPFGTGSYGVTRSSGAFANANASLDHYLMGLLVGAFDAGGGGGGSFSGFVG
jgi:hypothetical protein